MFRERPALTGLVALYMVVFSAMAVTRGNAEFIMYSGAMVVFIGVILLVHRRVTLSGVALWGLALWGLMHMAGGTVPAGTDADGATFVLYAWRPIEWLPKYDQVVHAFGFGVAALVSFEAISSGFDARTWDERRAHATVGVCAASALCAMGLGTVNEIVEFIAVLSLPETGVGGYMNTAWDMVSNAVGATTVALGIMIAARNARDAAT